MQRMVQNRFVSNFTVRGDFSIVNGRMIYCNRIVVPSVLRSKVLDRIHDGHQSVTKSREKANLTWLYGDQTLAVTFKTKCPHMRIVPRESTQTEERAVSH